MSVHNSKPGSEEDLFFELFSKALEAANKNAEEKNPVLLKKQHVWKSNYGLDESNPIISESLEGTSAYLSRLCTPDGKSFTWSGYTSIRASVHGLSDVGEDRYTLYLDGRPYTDLFFVPYVGRADFPPAGLCFTDDKRDWNEERLIAQRANELDVDQETARQMVAAETVDRAAAEKQTNNEGNSPNSVLFTGTNRSIEASTDNSSAQSKKPGSSGVSIDTSHKSSGDILTENTTVIQQGNLPVLVEKCSIIKKPNQEVYAVCSFLPTTDISILAMQADILCYDVWHEQVKSVEKFQFNDLKTSRGKSFGSDIIIPLPDSNTRWINVVIRRIILSDGTLIERSGDKNNTPYSLPSQQNNTPVQKSTQKSKITVPLVIIASILALGLLIYAGVTSSAATSPSSSASSSHSTSAPSTPIPTIAVPSPTPKTMPASGKVLYCNTTDRPSEFKVTNDGSLNYYMKFVKAGTNTTAMIFFVRAHTTVTIEMPAGNYELRYACGSIWYGEKYLFGDGTMYAKDEEYYDFTNYTWEISLHSSTYDGDTMNVEYINADEF